VEFISIVDDEAAFIFLQKRGRTIAERPLFVYTSISMYAVPVDWA